MQIQANIIKETIPDMEKHVQWPQGQKDFIIFEEVKESLSGQIVVRRVAGHAFGEVRKVKL